MQQSLRTQICLPKKLRQAIDNQRALNGESLAQYLRNAASQRLEKEKNKKTNLKKLTEEIFSSPKIAKTRADKWLKEIRKNRQLEDEKRNSR